jgi:GNAT superfamily N-acetyltransferase
LTIRPAQCEDAATILSLIEGVFAEYGFIFDPRADFPDILTFDESYGGANAAFYVVEEEGVIAGTIAVDLHPPGEEAEIKRLYVRASSRGRGFGRELVETALRWARESGARRMGLWTDTRFTAAHRLYESLGFEQSGERLLGDVNESFEYEYTLELD